jgi:hypothetical protein
LGKAAGFKGGIFFQGAWAKKRGQKKGKKIGEKGAKKKNNPFLGSFLGGRKKTEKLGKKNCFAPTQIAALPPFGQGNYFKKTTALLLIGGFFA